MWDVLKYIGDPSGTGGGGTFNKSMDITTELASAVVEDRLEMDIESPHSMSISRQGNETLTAEAGPALEAD
jgi:hypothetical protein